MSFRADRPSPFPDFSIYGILFIDDREGPFFEAAALQVQLDPSGQPELVAFRSAPIPPGPTITSNARPDFSSLDRIVLKLRYKSDDNLVFPSFSTDEGQNFTSFTNPDGSPFSISAFPVPGQTEGALQVFGAGKALPMMMRPVEGQITSKFGERELGFHLGIDIWNKDMPKFTVGVEAPAAGEVLEVNREVTSTQGKWVWIRHGDILRLDETLATEISTRYLHLHSISVEEGDSVSAGEVIGIVGDSGKEFFEDFKMNPHLHFEVRQGPDLENVFNTTPIDPEEFVLYEDPPETLSVKALSPVDLIVIDPDGLTISKEVNEFSEAAGYLEVGNNPEENLSGYDYVSIKERKKGDYLIKVVPEPQALPTDVYSIEVTSAGITMLLASDVGVGEISEEPYIIRSTETEIAKVIPAQVRIIPETLNLSQRGTFAAFLEIEKGFGVSVEDIDLETIRLDGFAPVFISLANEKLIARFRTEDFSGIPIGQSVSLELTGKLKDGTLFEGRDAIRTIRVTLPPGPSASAEFNGTDSILSRPSSPSLTLTSDFTLETWVKITQAPAPGENYLLLAKWQPFTERSYLWFYRTIATGAKQLLLCTSPDGIAISCSVLSGPPADLGENEWHHIAVRASLGPTRIEETEFFIDGARRRLFGGADLFLPKINQALFTIGAGEALGGTLFFPCNCKLDDVRVWNRARTASEIAADHLRELSGSEPGLVGYWKLNHNSNDSTRNRNHLTNSNVSFSDDTPGLQRVTRAVGELGPSLGGILASIYDIFVRFLESVRELWW